MTEPKIDPSAIEEMIRLARNWPDEPIYLYAGMDYAGDGHGAYAMAQHGRRAITRSDRPWWCPPGVPFVRLATVTEIDGAIVATFD